jgi:hypothetical protein
MKKKELIHPTTYINYHTCSDGVIYK